eukprot:scaffold97863_cov18-Prasinocladus_malaysianus.AAC.1
MSFGASCTEASSIRKRASAQSIYSLLIETESMRRDRIELFAGIMLMVAVDDVACVHLGSPHARFIASTLSAALLAFANNGRQRRGALGVSACRATSLTSPSVSHLAAAMGGYLDDSIILLKIFWSSDRFARILAPVLHSEMSSPHGGGMI